jgi:hypothetical protein
MATQGIISIVQDDKVLFKLVAGCNGMTAEKTANAIRKMKHEDMNVVSLYDIGMKHDFGCKDCLVVQSEMTYKAAEDEELSKLYFEKFQNAEFNPRWECGIASHVEIVKV